MCNRLPIFLGILLLFIQYVFVDASIAILESKANGTVTRLEAMKPAPVDVKE